MRTRHLATLSLGALVAGSGCNFAVKHPPATAAIVGGALGFATCELEVEKPGTCGIVGGSVGVGLGLIAAVALWVMQPDGADEGGIVDPVLNNPEDGPADIPADQRGDLDPHAAAAKPAVAPPAAPPAPPPAPAPAPDAPTPIPTPDLQ